MDGPVIFLDKDGTLVRDVPYNIDPAQIILERGAAPGLRRLAEAGFHFVVVSNQSGVARGFFKEEALEPVINRIAELLEQAAGIHLDGFYYCPHHPQGTVPEYRLECACRKPNPGMLLAAARNLDIDLNLAWMIGDILDDVEAGKRAGCRAILIDTGHETQWKAGPFRTPDFTAGSLEEAARIILSHRNDQPGLHQQANSGK
jgi:D-glycero-D-manno-heptose 1,7-bisphosphate phosphatase